MQSKARRSTKKNLVTLLKFIAAPALVVDGKSKILLINDALLGLSGLKKKDLIGKSFLDLSVLNEKNKARIAKKFEARLKGLPVKPYEVTLTDKNGEVRAIEITSKKIECFEHPIFLVVVHDITERKAKTKQLEEYSEKMEALVAEKARQIIESKEKLEAIFNSSPDAIVVTDLNGKLVEVNEAAIKLYGCSSKNGLIGKNVFELVSREEQANLSLLIENISRDGTVKNAEQIFLTENGRELPVEFSASFIKNSSDNPVGFVSIVKDISERKKAQEAIKESEEKFRDLSEESPNMIFINKKGEVVYANKKCEELMGYTKEEFYAPTFNFLSLIAPESLEKIKSIYSRHKLGEEAAPYEYDIVTKAGKRISVVITTKLIKYGGERAILGIVTDISERKHLETALRESEEMFRAISTSAIDAIILLDKRGKVTYWNPAAERIFGYTSEEAIGKPLDALIIPEKYRGMHSKSAMKTFENGKHHKTSMEFKALRKNGKEVPIELSISLLQLKDKKHLLGIIRDTSERKRMETTLQEAEKRYHALFNKAPLGILLLDETATAVEFNEEAYRHLGYTREEFAKLTVSDYEVIETTKETKARMKKIMREGKDEFETKHRTKNGEIRDVIISVQVIELAGKKLFHLISKDVTEQKKIERELKIEKAKLEAVTENIGAGLAIISKDYQILWANKLLKQINGECEGKICYSTFNRLSEVCPDCGVKKVFETGVSLDIHEYSNVDDKGNRFWVELIITPIKDENGNVIAALELAVNITERKIMENKLAEYSQKLEKVVEKRTRQLQQAQAKLVKSERLAAIGELAAMVGHDLRNPLTGIMGATYYLKNKHNGELGAKGQEMLETIEKAILYSNKIVNDLLEYSKDLKLEITETTPKDLFKNSLSLIEVPEAIRIVDATEDKPTIKADAEKMQRVFINLIRNAFDAMPEGGTLTVKSKEVKGKLKISFKDTGTGMSKVTLSKLKGDVLLFTTKAKGMGFGLPICKRIAEAHDGKLSVESKVGKGTVITITLPVNPEPANENEVKLFFNHFMLDAIAAKQKAKQTPSP
ncbi:PAS domain S-box protein [Candidatus Bathyarchaeota archaeon]|nr:PAS domain S-box protein [Candidatus Bathyarchaeota archaeon]